MAEKHLGRVVLRSIALACVLIAVGYGYVDNWKWAGICAGLAFWLYTVEGLNALNAIGRE